MSRSLRTTHGNCYAEAATSRPGFLSEASLAAPAFANTAFAAADIALDDLQLPILVGSLVLLVIGLALKVARRRSTGAAVPPAPAAQPEQGFSEGIGRYRCNWAAAGLVQPLTDLAGGLAPLRAALGPIDALAAAPRLPEALD